VGYDEIASRDKSELEHEFVVWVGEFRSQSKVDRMMPALLAQHVHDKAQQTYSAANEHRRSFLKADTTRLGSIGGRQ